MKIILKIIAKTLLIIVIVLAVAAGGGYAYLKYSGTQTSGSAASSVQTAKLAAGTIDTTVSASGTVRTRQTAQVSWQASGKVATVAVKVGDTVKANDIIATLDTSALSMDSSTLTNAIITAQADLLTAQQALTDLQNNTTDLPTAKLALLTAQTAVDTAQTVRDRLNYARGTETQIAAAKAAVLLAQQKVKEMQSIYNGTAGNVATDPHKAQAYNQLTAAQTGLASSESNLAWILGSASATDIATADTNLALAKAKLADAQAAYDKLKNGPDASQIASAEQRIAADQAIINSKNVYAPFDCTISSISVMPGDVVSNGTAAFRIDDTSSYYIDLSVSEVDIANIRVGQPASVTFSAISNKTYNAKVTKVGQVGTSANSVVTFTVTVQITDADASIKPGMTASSTVVVSSVSNVLVVSNKSIKTISGQKYVYILTTSSSTAASGSTTGTPAASTAVQQIVPVKVTAGATNGTQTQITSSQLKAGDLILTSPTSTTTATTLSTNQSSGLSGLLGGLLGGATSGGGGPSGGGSPPSGGGSAPSGGSAPAGGSSSSGGG